MLTYEIPAMLIGNELKEALTILPYYDKNIRSRSQSERLIALNDIYNIYYPSNMGIEIYSKLYLAYLRAMQKKNTFIATKQHYENKKACLSQSYQGLIGGSDSFTIIGVSGIGKSSAISRAISLISKDKVITSDNYKTIPFLVVQTPHDSSVKSLLLEILRKVDEALCTKYYNDSIRARATLDMLIGAVSQVCLNHICVLVLDEVQNVVNSKNGKTLIGSLVQLINNSGISVCFIGTPECNNFFEMDFKLARRSLGLYYSCLPFDEYFIKLCDIAFSYQYVKHKSEFNYSIAEWLYNHSGGITAVVIGLIHDAQEMSILDCSECLGVQSLTKAYNERLRMLHKFISEQQKSIYTPKHIDNNLPSIQNDLLSIDEVLIKTTIDKAKNKSIDVIKYLQEFLTVEEIPI